MPIKIGLIGATGRLGSVIEQLCQGENGLEIAARFGRNDSLLEGTFDLYLDVALPPGLQDRLTAAIETNRPLIIGITGLDENDLVSIELASKKIPIFYAPNFSLGITILKHLVADVAERFYREATIALTETHHVHKKDAPSGAAKLLASSIEENHPDNKSAAIQSFRIGEVIGTHDVVFNTEQEQIRLTHTAHNRELFARGALLAVRFLSTQSPGLYTMDDLYRRSSSCKTSPLES
jgi:4-hydroxy-tetrahydrodipicolinate reductase